MKNSIAVIMIAMMLFIGHVHAQQTNYSGKFRDVIITGSVTDSLIKTRPDGKTTVIVRVSKYPFSYAGIPAAKNDTYEVVVKYKEAFHIRVPAPAGRFYMSIDYYPSRNEVLQWSGIDNIYILDQGDRIKADLGRAYFSFSGKGAAKLNCESELYNASYRGWSIDPKTSEELVLLSDQGKFSERYALMERGKDSCLLVQKAILEKYKKRLGKKLSDIMLANCYGIRYYWTLRGARQISDSDPACYRVVINSPDYKKIDLSLNEKMDPDILANAPIYVDFLFEKIRMDNSLEADGTRQMALYHRKQFNEIKLNYRGIIRDKLLALFFITNSKSDNSIDSLNAALNLCGPTIYREILINVKETQSKGEPFYPFELPDTKGNRVRLADLGKKVVVLDFWYTGCVHCINLHHNMAPIYDKYKDNPDVAFVSVSIDKDKKQWIKSVLSNKYTDANDINLFTDGQGGKHPLMTKYSISSFPTVFILKDGKMFSSGPPRPNSKSLNEGTTLDYVNLIEAAIADKSL